MGSRQTLDVADGAIEATTSGLSDTIDDKACALGADVLGELHVPVFVVAVGEDADAQLAADLDALNEDPVADLAGGLHGVGDFHGGDGAEGRDLREGSGASPPPSRKFRAPKV